MTRKTRIALVLALAGAVLAIGAGWAGLRGAAAAAAAAPPEKLPANLAGLAGPFDLGGPIKPEVRYYIQTTDYVSFGLDGRRTGVTTYVVRLKVVPPALSGKGGDEYTVGEFSLKTGGGEAETIPALAGWSYVFRKSETGRDEKGQVLGIPHDKFLGLVTSAGRKLGAVASYPIYNSFIDFHGFNDEFARPTAGDGGGIQDLTAIGRTVRHASAFSEPPVDLGSGIKEGSVFRNGEVRLTFKGIGLVEGAACAIVGYDSGESTLTMIMLQPDGKEITTEGGSQYVGDIYVDLGARWVRKVTMDEHVVTETRLPGAAAGAPGQKFPGYTVRHLLTRMVSRAEFEK
jgi:hypothetical protein